MEWTWDADKAHANLGTHGVAFEAAVLVFDDPLHVSEPDPHGDGWRAIGRVNLSLLFVVHPMIEPDGRARIISARKATPTERKRYDGRRS